MSDETNVEAPEEVTAEDAVVAEAEAVADEPVAEDAATVSDAVEAARPEDRKREIKRNMDANYHTKVAKRDKLRNEGVKTLVTGVDDGRSE